LKRRVIGTLVGILVSLVTSNGLAFASTNTGVLVSPGHLTIRQQVVPNTKELVAPYSIKNTGDDILHTTITPTGYLTVSARQLTILPGEIKFVYVYLDVPKNTTLGAHTDSIIVDAQSPADPRNSITVKDTVTYNIGTPSLWSAIMEFLSTHMTQISIGCIAAFIIGLWIPKLRRSRKEKSL
jgi:hypothetical protein